MAGRIVSGVIAVGYIVAVLLAKGPAWACYGAMILFLPLACIWFSDGLGYYGAIGWRGPRSIEENATPGCFVAFWGWLALLLVVVGSLIAAFAQDPP